MKQNFKQKEIKNQNNFKNLLEEILKEGARKMLQAAIENEVQEYVEAFKEVKDEKGHQMVIRNGYQPERAIQTGVGAISIYKPRIKDKSSSNKFTSAILPRYMRRCPSIDALIPALYLRGISTNNFQDGLSAILGEHAKGLSSTNIVRLKQIWEEEYKEWQKRDLSNKRYVYIWADGIYFNVRLDKDRPCILVIIGATEDGKKELIAIHDGHRESTLSWKEVLIDLKKRGLTINPSLAIGDGALGFWKALEEEFPETKKQRCWVHKTANILDKMPKRVQPNAKNLIHEMYKSETKKKALSSYKAFLKLYSKYERACKCLEKDFDFMFTFYDFPEQHWQHIRSTNVIESTFATIRHRTRQTKGCGSRTATLSMVYKLAKSAEKCWYKLKGYKLIEKIIKGIKFKDGEEIKDDENAA